MAVPADKAQGIRFVTVEYVVDEIIYRYAFRNNRVVSIDFDSCSVIDKSL